MPDNTIHTNNFTPIVTQKASEMIYEQIKELILTGKIKPGERLPSERNLMDSFKRSRPTIREALRMLEQNNFIRIIPGSSGAEVLPPNTHNLEDQIEMAVQVNDLTIEEIGEYRIANETATARWTAVRRTEETLKELSEVLHQSSLALNDLDTFIDLDIRFHQLLAKASCNRLAAIMTHVLGKSIRNELMRNWRKHSPEQSLMMCNKVLVQHTAIYDAVKDQDADAAQQAVRTHLEHFMNDV